MNKKITIYELLGLIKDGKAPKYIIFDTDRYSLNPNYHYVREVGDEIIRLDIQYNLVNCLNEEVEIIDDRENEKISKLSWQQVGYQNCDGDERPLRDVVLDFNKQNDQIGKKINELVKGFNELRNSNGQK